jgi:hypothetical protein
LFNGREIRRLRAANLTTSSDLLFKFTEATKPVNLTLSKWSEKTGYETDKLLRNLLHNLKRGNTELAKGALAR